MAGNLTDAVTRDANTPGVSTNAEVIVFTVFYSIVIAVGLVGNSLSIAVFHRTKSLRNTTNYLLGNIAVADLLTVTSLIPFTFLKLLQHPMGTLGRIVCILITKSNLGSISLNVSIFTLGLLAIERYNALVRPMRIALRLTSTSVWYAIGFSWLSSIVFTLPLIVNTQLEEKSAICKFVFKSHAYWILAGVLLFAVFATICFCYFTIIRGFYFGEILNSSSGGTRGNDYRDKQKVVKMLVTVTVVFASCYLPRLAFLLLSTHLSKVVDIYLFRRISFLLLVSNSCINPIIYTLQSANFRSSAKRFLTGCCRQTPQRFNLDKLSRGSRIAPVQLVEGAN